MNRHRECDVNRERRLVNATCVPQSERTSRRCRPAEKIDVTKYWDELPSIRGEGNAGRIAT